MEGAAVGRVLGAGYDDALALGGLGSETLALAGSLSLFVATFFNGANIIWLLGLAR